MREHPVAAVANRFIESALADRIVLDHQALQKLCYLAHGFHLAITGLPLTRERPAAWPYGPAFPGLYQKLKPRGSSAMIRPVRGDGFDMLCAPTLPPGEARDVVDAVWSKYKQFSGVQLSSLTHDGGSPWAMVRGHGGATIPDAELARHYRGLLAA